MRNMTLVFLSLFVMGFLGCVSKPIVVKDECAPLPEIQSTQSLKDYTIQIIAMYKTCANLKAQ